MSIRKVKGLESDFTIVPNKTINDKLSWAARGMLLYLCSKPETWDVCMEDLVRQTTGSAKRSGRDAVRSIMKELIECGYMRKSQKNIKGVFQNADHEVSFLPFTENPYAVQPSTVHATQESTDITKYGNKKESNTDISKADDNLFSIDEVMNDFPLCSDAIHELTSLGKYNYKIYTGELTLSEWEYCESAMRSVDDFDVEYFTWWMKEKSPSMRKTPSLPNMLTDMNGTPFDQFYESAFMQECED